MFAARLKSAMSAMNITVESLALESGYSEKHIVFCRNGHTTNPTINFVKALADVLQVSPAWLVGWED